MSNEFNKTTQNQLPSETSTRMQQQPSSQQQQQYETPESEFSNFECYQNYTAPEVFVQHIAGIVNQGDVEVIVRAQKQMLQRFEKTNEMLLNCNALSSGRLKAANDDFKKHIKLINDMRKDLDYIFKKIRNSKLQRFEKTNEMLLNCNALSSGRLKAANDDFKKHIKLINDMRKDLDYIFKKIRNIESRIGVQYPQAMKRVEQKMKNSNLSEEEEDVQVAQSSSSQSVSTDKRTKDSIKTAKHSSERKLSKESSTVHYVQMETSTENGVCINPDGRIETETETVIVAGDGKTDNESTDNESSDTSDT